MGSLSSQRALIVSEVQRARNDDDAGLEPAAGLTGRWLLSDWKTGASGGDSDRMLMLSPSSAIDADNDTHLSGDRDGRIDTIASRVCSNCLRGFIASANRKVIARPCSSPLREGQTMCECSNPGALPPPTSLRVTLSIESRWTGTPRFPKAFPKHVLTGQARKGPKVALPSAILSEPVDLSDLVRTAEAVHLQ